MYVLMVPLEEGVSQIFNLSLSFHFMSKKGNFLTFFKTVFLHFIK